MRLAFSSFCSEKMALQLDRMTTSATSPTYHHSNMFQGRGAIQSGDHGEAPANTMQTLQQRSYFLNPRRTSSIVSGTAQRAIHKDDT